MKTRPDGSDALGRFLLSAAVSVMLRNADGLPDFQDDKLRIVHAVEPDNGDVQVGTLLFATQGYVNSETLRRLARNGFSAVWEDKEASLRSIIGANAYRVIRTVLAHLPHDIADVEDDAQVSQMIRSALGVLSEEVETNQMRFALGACLDGTAASPALNLSNRMQRLFEFIRAELPARVPLVDSEREAAQQQLQPQLQLQPQPQPQLGSLGEPAAEAQAQHAPAMASAQVLRLTPKMPSPPLSPITLSNAAHGIGENGAHAGSDASPIVKKIKRLSQQRAAKKTRRRQKGFSMELPALHNDDDATAMTIEVSKNRAAAGTAPRKSQDDSAIAELSRGRDKQTRRSRTGENLPGSPARNLAEAGAVDSTGEGKRSAPVKRRYSKKRHRLLKLIPKTRQAKPVGNIQEKSPRHLSHLDMLAQVPNQIKQTFAPVSWNILETMFGEMATIERFNRIASTTGKVVNEDLVRQTLMENVISQSMQIFFGESIFDLDAAVRELLGKLPKITVLTDFSQEKTDQNFIKPSREEKEPASRSNGLSNTVILKEKFIEPSREEEEYASRFNGLSNTLILIQNAIARQLEEDGRQAEQGDTIRSAARTNGRS
ncbi:MAG: hypothetical protein ACRYGK_09550 [Janthinobacterium lividum]